MAAEYPPKCANGVSAFIRVHMRVPPQVLSRTDGGMPMYEGVLTIRTPDLKSVHDQVNWYAAYGLAYQGLIEAVCNASGKIRYFRLLAEAERPKMETPTPIAPSADASRSTVIARTNLGVFREAVQAGVYSENGGPYGGPGIQMSIIGYVYQFCMLRSL